MYNEKLEQYGLLCCKQSFISTPTMIGLYLLPAAISLFSPLSSGAFIAQQQKSAGAVYCPNSGSRIFRYDIVFYDTNSLRWGI